MEPSDTRRSTVGTQCECADCRQYRLWRAEGTEEWQPDRDTAEWQSMARESYGVDTETPDADTVETLTAD
jgi:hypothetical protein